MSITLDNPTAKAIFEALREVPESELERLRQLLETARRPVNESDAWSEEDIEDFRRSTQRLIEKRIGPEEHDYD